VPPHLEQDSSAPAAGRNAVLYTHLRSHLATDLESLVGDSCLWEVAVIVGWYYSRVAAVSVRLNPRTETNLAGRTGRGGTIWGKDREGCLLDRSTGRVPELVSQQTHPSSWE
jgi:hypothetical protein